MRRRAVVVVMCLVFAAGVLGLARAPAEEKKAKGAVSTAQMEKALKDRNVTFTKGPEKEGHITYSFKLGKRDCVLDYDYGGEILVCQAFFKAAPLEVINQWNVQALLSRAVLYKATNTSTVECGLNCTGGVSDRILRHLVDQFRDEVGRFGQYLKKNRAGG